MLQGPQPYYKLSESTLKKLVRESQVSHQKAFIRQSSVGSNSTPHAPRVKKTLLLPQDETTQPVENVLTPPSTAWDRETIAVQPFRRAKYKPLPLGVPLLDLSQFNEPDSQMDPVRIRVTMETGRSRVSWGAHSLDHGTLAPEQLVVEDVGELFNDETTPIADLKDSSPTLGEESHDTSLLEPSQAKFIESKLLSNERSLPQPPLNAETELEAMNPDYSCSPLGVLSRHPETRVKPIMVPETSLNKKLRFEARVLTQNGRDVHRELCGFFFLADSSLTIYEFRQFGKKSSALPIIQRGVYHHLFGAHRGDPYEVNVIRKGKILHFHTNNHSGLPDTLAARPVLGLKITYVDEAAKKLLLTDGLNPVEIRQIEKYLVESGNSQDERKQELYKALQCLVVSRLLGRASKTLVGLGRQLAAMGRNVTKQQLQQCLRNYHISLTVEDMNQLWVFMCSEQNDLKASLTSGHHNSSHHTTTSSLNSFYDDRSVSVDGLISRLIGPIPEDRLTSVRKVFRKLDSTKTGLVHSEVVHRFFTASKHPNVLAGIQSAEEVWSSLSDCLNGIGRGTMLSYADLEHYYHGVSIEVGSDSDFTALLKNCWCL